MEIKRRKAQPFTVEEDHEVMELREALAASQREREQGQSKIAELQAEVDDWRGRFGWEHESPEECQQQLEAGIERIKDENKQLQKERERLVARLDAAEKLIAICAKREEGSEDFFDAELNAFLASAAAPNSAPVTSGDSPKAAG